MRTVSIQEPVNDAVRRVLDGRHRDPFEVLGCHREGSGWQIRALLPDAAEAEVVWADSRLPMQRLPDTDLFTCGVVSTAMPG